MCSPGRALPLTEPILTNWGFFVDQEIMKLVLNPLKGLWEYHICLIFWSGCNKYSRLRILISFSESCKLEVFSLLVSAFSLVAEDLLETHFFTTLRPQRQNWPPSSSPSNKQWCPSLLYTLLSNCILLSILLHHFSVVTLFTWVRMSLSPTRRKYSLKGFSHSCVQCTYNPT